jgi:hypothetical protein
LTWAWEADPAIIQAKTSSFGAEILISKWILTVLSPQNKKRFDISRRFLIFLHQFSTTNHPSMKNRNIVHSNQSADIYREYYRPSLNVWRFTKSILGVLFFGRSTCANSYVSTNKRILK